MGRPPPCPTGWLSSAPASHGSTLGYAALTRPKFYHLRKIWVAPGRPLAAPAASALEAAGRDGTEVLVSPMSFWEIGMLTARGRIALAAPPRMWFRRTLSATGFGLAEQTPEILIESFFLPGSPPRDPMDRIIIATAREHGLRVVTRDRAILAYASAGHVSALAC